MKRNYKIDNIRAIAILMVIFGHSIILYSSDWLIFESINSCNILDIVKKVINLIQMPVFFSLSGYLLYLKKEKIKKFTKFVENKIRRLIIPYIAIGFIWMIPIKMLIKLNGYSESYIENCFKLLLGKNQGHLWYITSLFLMFIITYVYIKIIRIRRNRKDKNKKEENKKYIKYAKEEYLDIIMYIIVFLSTFIKLNANYNLNKITIILNEYIYPLIIPFLNNYIFFITGCFISKYGPKLINKNKNKIRIIINILFLILIVIELHNKNIVLEKIIGIISIIFMFMNVCNKENKILNKISKNSFGMYLLHSPLIYITFAYLKDSNPIIVVFLNFIIFGTLSYLLTEIIRKSKLKFIIGE